MHNCVVYIHNLLFETNLITTKTMTTITHHPLYIAKYVPLHHHQQ